MGIGLRTGARRMMIAPRLFCVGLLASISAVGAAAPNGYTLYWSDEFNLGLGSHANLVNWSYDLGNSGWGNNELENYTSKLANSHIVADQDASDGLALQIQAIETSPGVYTSARLLSQGKLSIKYGFIESRLRLTYGQGIWPAFWMLGSNINGVGWPTCGEADIMENIGNDPNTNWGSLHAPNFNPSVTYTLSSPNVFHSAYHVFQASWSPNCFAFYVDDNLYHSENLNNNANWPFNEPMFFIMNVAVGGNWPGSPDSTTIFPQNLLVDYVRVYHLTGPTSNEIVSFFSSANSKFVSAENAGANPLDCSRTVASTWEQFLVVDLGSNHIALQSQANGKFVTVMSDSSSALIANGASVSNAATFSWMPNPDGTVYLKSVSNGKYVTVDATQDPPAIVAIASRAALQDAFGVTCYGQLAAPSTPSVPQGLSAHSGPGSVAVSWTPVSGASSYVLYESALPGGAGMSPIATVTGTKFTKVGLTPGRAYSFAVTALNSQGMSLRSAMATSKPLPR